MSRETSDWSDLNTRAELLVSPQNKCLFQEFEPELTQMRYLKHVCGLGLHQYTYVLGNDKIQKDSRLDFDTTGSWLHLDFSLSWRETCWSGLEAFSSYCGTWLWTQLVLLSALTLDLRALTCELSQDLTLDSVLMVLAWNLTRDLLVLTWDLRSQCGLYGPFVAVNWLNYWRRLYYFKLCSGSGLCCLPLLSCGGFSLLWHQSSYYLLYD